jgi:omega-3 fatty acid desaturase (delta-15 desaturase)
MTKRVIQYKKFEVFCLNVEAVKIKKNDQNQNLESRKTDFTIKQLKDTIPAHLFESSLLKSLFYFFFDSSIIISLFSLAFWLDSYYFYPIYWILQGTFMWSLFVVGHDCGHGSFSKYKWVNSLIGHISHSPLLVPYHGWRISHRTHHNNTGNMDKDESWYPIAKSDYDKMDSLSKFVRFKIILFVFPIYLFVRSPMRDGSHFLPSSDLFSESEKWDVVVSTFWWTSMLVGLSLFGYFFGITALLNLYVVPYIIFVMWLSMVTYLHHTDIEVPWYRNSTWSFVKGALSTVDRKYGLIEPIHHNIGTHVVHHIFSKIPHYNLLEANKYLKDAIGEDMYISKEPILKALYKSYINCIYMSDEGEKVYYSKKS